MVHFENLKHGSVRKWKKISNPKKFLILKGFYPKKFFNPDQIIAHSSLIASATSPTASPVKTFMRTMFPKKTLRTRKMIRKASLPPRTEYPVETKSSNSYSPTIIEKVARKLRPRVL